jgi:predicted Zn-dependent protease
MKTRSKRTARREERIEIGFLEALRKRCPSDDQILEALGDLYTKTGRYEDGLAVDLELVQQRPQEDRVWYNLACSYALVGKPTEALNALGRSVSMGYDDLDHLSKDPDLDSIRQDPRFKELIVRIKQNCSCPF